MQDPSTQMVATRETLQRCARFTFSARSAARMACTTSVSSELWPSGAPRKSGPPCSEFYVSNFAEDIWSHFLSLIFTVSKLLVRSNPITDSRRLTASRNQVGNLDADANTWPAFSRSAAEVQQKYSWMQGPLAPSSHNPAAAPPVPAWREACHRRAAQRTPPPRSDHFLSAGRL